MAFVLSELTASDTATIGGANGRVSRQVTERSMSENYVATRVP
jgi:hypothetical protein